MFCRDDCADEHAQCHVCTALPSIMLTSAPSHSPNTATPFTCEGTAIAHFPCSSPNHESRRCKVLVSTHFSLMKHFDPEMRALTADCNLHTLLEAENWLQMTPATAPKVTIRRKSYCQKTCQWQSHKACKVPQSPSMLFGSAISKRLDNDSVSAPGSCTCWCLPWCHLKHLFTL